MLYSALKACLLFHHPTPVSSHSFTILAILLFSLLTDRAYRFSDGDEPQRLRILSKDFSLVLSNEKDFFGRLHKSA